MTSMIGCCGEGTVIQAGLPDPFTGFFIRNWPPVLRVLLFVLLFMCVHVCIPCDTGSMFHSEKSLSGLQEWISKCWTLGKEWRLWRERCSVALESSCTAGINGRFHQEPGKWGHWWLVGTGSALISIFSASQNCVG